MKKIKFSIVIAIAAVLVFGSVLMTACGEETPAPHTHELTAVSEKAATCTEDGYEAYWKCDGCGKLFSDENGNTEITAPKVIEATGHSGGTATCTQKAVCEVCGEEYGELAAHVYDKEVADAEYLKSAATCTSLAVYYKSCVCGAKGTETFTSGSTLAHSYTVLQHDASGHWYKCANCDATDEKQAHSGGTATCAQKAVCEVCGEEYGELAAHVYDREVASAEYLKSAATCTSPAVYYKSCVCGAKGTETFTSGEVGDHSWSEWSDASGKDSHSCVVCGKTENRTVFNAVDATYSGVSANPNGYLSGTAAGGAVVTFTINSSAACEAELIISLAKAGTGLPISQLYDITVNNTPYTGYTDFTPEYAGWEEFRDGSLGDVQLQEGVNTITFMSKSNDQQIAYNFKSIKLIADQNIEFTEPLKKTTSVFNAVDATYSGVSANPNGYLSGTAAGGAVVTFTINSSAACEAELIISLAKAGTGLPISQLYDITVNNTPYTGYTDFTPEYAGWEEFRDGSLGDVQLQEGVNTITFTSKSNDQQIAYNFKSIKLITVGVEISAGQA